MKLLVCALSVPVGCPALPRPAAAGRAGVATVLTTAVCAAVVASTGACCVCSTAGVAVCTARVCAFALVCGVALETAVAWPPVVVPALADLCE
jgi:hypothetical protein